MKISLLTDAPKHNLALMKISAWHKSCGDSVMLNFPIFPADYRYASVLFEKNKHDFVADEYGGPVFNDFCLPIHIESVKPDYSLYGLDFSVGYTFRPCFRKCEFCKVPDMKHPDKNHHSIWDFHDPEYKKICLLNNNTFFDPQWRETFDEILDADLTVIDENGYDLRLLNLEKTIALKNLKFEGKLHFAWDKIEDEKEIVRGLELLKKYKINNAHIYVLIGFDTDQEQDFHRCQKIIDFGFDPYIMPFNQTKNEKRFKRFIDSFMWRKYKTIKEAWENYNG